MNHRENKKLDKMEKLLRIVLRGIVIIVCSFVRLDNPEAVAELKSFLEEVKDA